MCGMYEIIFTSFLKEWVVLLSPSWGRLSLETCSVASKRPVGLELEHSRQEMMCYFLALLH